ncbi:uncharacterized protein GGS25DRAFT_236926 [Hypoxylon fragiforme]|uniref:uncharacterized protein n=1 Tax=Hypoxylon fragiforme TaxID=63214 RepID=UPI0020C690AF|nr:uncharacterized protein GGS25DRAFT_236926 [Hypoxylon fragiforme]KAI2609858.1 hypothetical protein GGS25DRAFT_236926 [Hypoxylon fragiforme]
MPSEVSKACSMMELADDDCRNIRVTLRALPPATDLSVPSAISSTKRLGSRSDGDTADVSDTTIPSTLSVIKAFYKDRFSDDLLHRLSSDRNPKCYFLSRRPARNLPRQNEPKGKNATKEFQDKKCTNLIAVLLQVAGIRRNRNDGCDRCKAGRGFWDLCVVALPEFGDFSSSCANCHYNGRGIYCSFVKKRRVNG